MGRRSLGLSHVDALSGSEAEKERLRTILLSLTGELAVSEACARLSVSESRFSELRAAALAGALAALAPKAPGRPRNPSVEPEEVTALRRRVKDLELDLACACVKTEIALVMPKLLVREEPLPEAKKGGPHPGVRSRGGASSPGTSRGSGGSSRP